MKRYDHWKTTPPEPQMLTWHPWMLWDSDTATWKVDKSSSYRTADLTGHRCPSCCRFMTTTPDADEAEVVDGVATFTFRCKSCSALHLVAVAAFEANP